MTTAHDVEPVLPEPGQTADASEEPGSQLNRRKLIQGAAVAGTVVAAGVTLAACGGSPSGSGTSGGSGGSGNVLANTSQIPVGGGMIFDSQHVVVTQPTAGTFKAFSSTCTHMGCTVFKVSNGLIMCPCHGSEYSVVDGSVKHGPAPRPLPPEKITVTGNQITLDS